MKNLSPIHFLICLVTIFLFVNFYFIFDYLLNGYSRKNTKNKNKTKRASEVDVLKEYVDFNNTSFENKGSVHFYYGAQKRADMIFNEYQKNHFDGNNNSTTIDAKSEQCHYFYDRRTNFLVDSKGKLCQIEMFDRDLQCCIEDSGISSFVDACLEDIQCCKFESMCIYKCLSTLPLDNKFQTCRKICRMEYYSSRIYPYCYLTNTSSLHISYAVSRPDESCDEACQSSVGRVCHNHILSYYNNCATLAFAQGKCSKCQESTKKLYGPGIISRSSNLKTQNETICLTSDEFSISCRFKDPAIIRICPCIDNIHI